ncbi:DUF2330 domain-containing protein [Streptomyces sp. ISL-36]|uniref:DUF2330 domain-containing protein n=1 Tax=Streptomyces sp. ISL-36 TaxID=2819182 RepID=UPI001BEBA250|nr:DUF2330 domain-containing protein [Streptomyces sp. ISL-36]MBT2443316.1 DUF2330 domain-containing protein [Streptomyces sp. ISL-36]
MRGMQRLLAMLVALFALQLGSLVASAHACGCGAMIPDRSQRIGVDRETSAVRWDGRTEQIVMRFTVRGNAERAAWIMPVPTRADVELGDPELFDELDRLTRPAYRDRHHFWPRGDDWPFAGGAGDGAAAAPPGDAGADVGVVGRERLGPFDVARLTATDPGALSGWLEKNGFELSDRLAGELEPYVEQKWEYVAVRLAPDQKATGAEGAEGTGTDGTDTDGTGNDGTGAGGRGTEGARAVLRGDLDPLRISFASDRLVYPMRLSRLAPTPQSLGLYVLADHRMEPRGDIGGAKPEVTFAGEITEPAGPVAALTGGRPVYLTALDQEFPEPSRIDGDHELRTVADTPYQEVIYTDRLLTIGGGIPVWLLTVSGVLAVVAGTVGALVAVRRRGPRGAVRSAP